MWTADNRPRYNRDKLRYPSDLTDAEWAPHACDPGNADRVLGYLSVVVKRSSASIINQRRLPHEFQQR